MEPLSYLTRISHRPPVGADLAALRSLHLAHLRSAPFENLDIHLGRPIHLGLEHLFTKIVLARRGGFCYELNGLFAWLLRRLGFRVTLLSAGVVRADGSFGPEFDHLVLRVHQPGGPCGDDWLADVGFGDSFLEPLPLVPDLVSEQAGRAFKLELHEGRFHLMCLEADAGWRPQYRFTLDERALEDFESMCTYHQRSPASSFTQHCTATIATDGGRMTLADFRLITTRDRVKEERAIVDRRDYGDALIRHFGIELPQSDVNRLTSGLN